MTTGKITPKINKLIDFIAAARPGLALSHDHGWHECAVGLYLRDCGFITKDERTAAATELYERAERKGGYRSEVMELLSSTYGAVGTMGELKEQIRVIIHKYDVLFNDEVDE